jgi:flagellar hook-associated protein 3 FlgL
MRITNNMLTQNLLRNLEKANNRMELLQNQLSSGQAITKPSDDPVKIGTALRLKSNVTSMQQWKSNASEALSYMNTTEGTLSDMTAMLQRIKELAVDGANGSNSLSDRQEIALEVDQLTQQFQVLANSQVGNKYIFGGTNIDKAPLSTDHLATLVASDFTPVPSIGGSYTGETSQSYTIKVASVNSGSGEVTGIRVSTDGGTTYGDVISKTGGSFDIGDGLTFTVADDAGNAVDQTAQVNATVFQWSGNTNSFQFEVGPQVKIDVSINGAQLFGITSNAGIQSSSFFDTLQKLSSGLKTDDDDKIQSSLTEIDSQIDNLLNLRAELGARTNRLTTISDQLDNSLLNLQSHLSTIQDADMAKTILDFQSVQNVYRAALSVGAQIIQPSLVDFIK